MKSLMRLFPQITKFLLVGGVNTVIHFFVYNLLILVTSLTTGIALALFTSIAFVCANANSYLLNKNWTFRHKLTTESPVGNLEPDTQKEDVTKFGTFFVVSLGGLFINMIVVYSIVSYIPPFFQLIPHTIISDLTLSTLWANAALLMATAFSLVWNFIGYKLLVFKAAAKDSHTSTVKNEDA